MHNLLQSAKKSTRAAHRYTLTENPITASARKLSRSVRSHFASEPTTNDTRTVIQNAVKTILDQMIESEEIEDEVMGLAVEVLGKANTHKTPAVFQVKYRTRNGKGLRTKNFVELPIPRKTKEFVANDSKQTQLRLRANLLHNILQSQCGIDEVESQKQVLQSLVEKRLGGSLSWDETVFTVEDVVAAREMVDGVSTNVIVNVFESLAKLTGSKKMFPTRLHKKIGELEATLPAYGHENVGSRCKERKERLLPILLRKIGFTAIGITRCIRHS